MRRVFAVGACLASLLEAASLHAQSNTSAASSSGKTDAPAAATSAGAPPASAPPAMPGSPSSDGSLIEARAAFQEGTRLAKEGRCPDAIAAFERSEAMHPHAITTYNIGYCERLLGHWTRARKMLQKAFADHKARGGVELPSDLVSAIQAFLVEANRQIGRVLVTVASEGGAVAVDGRPLELMATEGPRPVLLAGTREISPPEAPPTLTFEVQLDPGSHVFVLAMQGRADVVTSQTIAPGSQAMLELRAPAPDAASVRDVPSGQAVTMEKPNHMPAFVALGIGAAGIATGTVSGLLAFAQKNAIHNACGPNGDSTSCDARREAGNRAADISTVGFIGGGAGVALGAILFFTASGRRNTKVPAGVSTASDVRPWVSWQAIGVQGKF
jgi:hypothetical protein